MKRLFLAGFLTILILSILGNLWQYIYTLSIFLYKLQEYEGLKMSSSLRTVCDINTGNEAILTVLFVKDGIVVAYAEVERNDADFATEQIERTYIFPFHQDFMMDEDRRCRFCEE